MNNQNITMKNIIDFIIVTLIMTIIAIILIIMTYLMFGGKYVDTKNRTIEKLEIKSYNSSRGFLVNNYYLLYKDDKNKMKEMKIPEHIYDEIIENKMTTVDISRYKLFMKKNEDEYGYKLDYSEDYNNHKKYRIIDF